MSFQIGAIGAGQVQNRPSQEEIQQQLEDLGIPSDVISQGRDAVESYAQTNGIQLPTGGNPSAQVEMQQTQNPFQMGEQQTVKEEFEAQLLALDIPQDTIDEGKEAVEAYASENGITLPSPPEKGMNLELIA